MHVEAYNDYSVKQELHLDNKYLSDGKYQQAKLSFNKIITIKPSNVQARECLLKNYAAAIKKVNYANNVLSKDVELKANKQTTGSSNGNTGGTSETTDSQVNVGSNETNTVNQPNTANKTKYSVVTSVTGSGSINSSPSASSYDEGTVVTYTEAPAKGWKFDHWTGDLSGTANSVQITMDGNKNVTAVFVEDSQAANQTEGDLTTQNTVSK
jgi:hypothetical protein